MDLLTAFALSISSLQVNHPVNLCMVKSRADLFNDYPQQIQVGESQRVTYIQKLGYYAVHYAPSDSAPSGAMLVFGEDGIAVFHDDPARTDHQDCTMLEDTAVTPVYALQSSGQMAVPTGLVFIRFAETVAAEAQRQAIAQAGYEIAQIPSYAPHAAWLRARSGKMADALTGLSRLAAIATVENVEPQMLMPRQQR
jgi:hypothetical protein